MANDSEETRVEPHPTHNDGAQTGRSHTGHRHVHAVGHTESWTGSTPVNPLRESLHALSRELADGSRQINQYHILRPIGQGSYGVVYLGKVRDETDYLVAIKEFGKMRLHRNLRVSQHRRMRIPQKVLQYSAEDEERDPLFLVRTEVAIMKKLRHPNVIRLYEVLEDSEHDNLYMVFEYCANGAICDVKPGKQASPLPETTARKYFGQVLSGIDYLHEHGIVHRDIKPDNILLTNNGETCKIVDFGVSKMFMKSSDYTMFLEAGSPAFMSPALCKGGHRESDGCPDDVWAFGVTLYCMVSGRLPFFKDALLDLYDSIQNDPLVLEDHLSPECRDLLSRMLDKDEKTRITIREIYHHPWVNQPGAPPIPTLEEIENHMVEEITEEDMQCAICRMSSVFAVARAVSRFKRRSTVRSDSDSFSDSNTNSARRRDDFFLSPKRVASPAQVDERPSDADAALPSESQQLESKDRWIDSPLASDQLKDLSITDEPEQDLTIDDYVIYSSPTEES
ncbi:hypothetical protein CBS14141_002107 [Malassezia furfur]|nr:hypothetical protein CBS14141_002107 [Malassezia furfur]